MLVDLWGKKSFEANGNIFMIFDVAEFSANDLTFCFFLWIS